MYSDSSVATAAYHGYEWQTVTTKQLAKNQPVTVKFDQIDREKINSLNVKVFGKRIQAIDDNGAFILGEEEKIADYTRDFNGDLYFDLDASVSKDTVRFVFDYNGNDGEKIDEKYRTVYLADLAHKQETTCNPKIGVSDPTKRTATAEDFEELTIQFRDFAPFTRIYVSGKLNKEFDGKVKEEAAELIQHIEVQYMGRPTGNKI